MCFVAILSNGQGDELWADGVEMSDLRWIDLHSALELHSRGQFPMAPPTWYVAKELLVSSIQNGLAGVRKEAASRSINGLAHFPLLPSTQSRLGL